MAIKINNITPEMSVWGMRLMGARNTPSEPSYAYNYTIKVGPNGEIENNTTLNLGRCGDIEVCKLVFDISDIKNYNENGTDNTGEYNVYCVFRHNDINTTYEVELSGNTGTLILPEEMTNEAGDYEMILVFQEAKSLDKTPNVPEAREYFVSDVFKGNVQESAWQYVRSTKDFNDFKTGSDRSIYKTQITIQSQENTINNPYIMSGPDDNLGNQGDRYVKQINWTNTKRHGLNNFIVYFFNEQHSKCYGYKVYNTDIVWVPEEVTDLRNEDENTTNWKMLLTLTNGDNTQRLVYNTLEFEITDNWLTVDDLYIDINKNYVLLRDVEDILLLDREGVILTAPVEE